MKIPRSTLFSFALISSLIVTGCQHSSTSQSDMAADHIAIDEPEVRSDLIPSVRVETLPAVVDTPEPVEEVAVPKPAVLPEAVSTPKAAVPVEVAKSSEPASSNQEPHESVDLPKGARKTIDRVHEKVDLSPEQYHQIELILADRTVEFKKLMKQKGSMTPEAFNSQKSQLFGEYYRKYVAVLTPEQRALLR